MKLNKLMISGLLAFARNRLGSWRYRWLVSYSSLILLIAISYVPIQRIIKDQSSSFVLIISNITLNLILLFGLWGLVSDKLTKKMPKWVGWAIFFAGLFAMNLFLIKGAGFETRFR